MIEKEFVPYQEALSLKELGFNEPCLAQYKKYDVGNATLDIGFSKNEIIMQFHKLSKFCSAPTFSQVFRWFRDKYNLRSWIESFDKTNYKAIILNHYGSTFNSPEEAELECLRKLIELTKVQEINRR